MRSFWLLMLLFGSTSFSWSQKEVPITATQWLNQLDSLLSLSQDQEIKLEGIYLNYELEKTSIELALMELQKEPMDPSEWEIKDSALRKRRKDLSREKEEKIMSELTAEQQLIYIEKISPNKPQVLHMGLKHDRINCTVCVKPTTP